MFCFDNPLRFCENIEGRKKYRVKRVPHKHARKCHFYRVSEIYAWRGQTPCVMSVTALVQRSSYHRTRIRIASKT
ncbi:hypothetical protein DBY73_017285 [Enterobacter sp. RIT418]|nr:hypothetical protein DBY73_017285 [Enterobacter sp. RIT 418]